MLKFPALCALLLASRAHGQSSPTNPPPADAPATDRAISMLSEEQTAQFDVAIKRADEACDGGPVSCYRECNTPNEEACNLLAIAWVSGRLNNQALLPETEAGRKLTLLVCRKATPRQCARLGVALRELPDNPDQHRQIAREALAAACTRGFKPACAWQALPDNQPLPGELANWALYERPYSDDPALVGCDQPLLPAKIIKRKEPDYPAKLRNRGIDGRVFLKFTIGTDGEVKNPSVTGRTAEGFDDASLAALRQWKYEPARSCGVAVPVERMATMIFQVH